MGQPTARDPETPGSGAQHAERFFINVIWTWTGVVANLFIGFVLSPYIIRKLGEERYGIWALSFALIEYLGLFDLGFRSAVVNYASRFRAQRQPDRINEVINTALCYFLGIFVIGLVLTGVSAGQVHRFFHITEAYRPEFSTLILLIGFSWAAGIVCSIFQASLEAFQQFKVYNHIWISTVVVRAAGCALLLYRGQGLVAMGGMVVASQLMGYLLTVVALRRIFPELRFSTALVKFSRLKEMAAYGIHSFLASSSSLLLNQGPPVLVGHFRPEAFVGFYTLPQRLLHYTVDALARIGFVTAPNTAELVALGRLQHVIKLGIYLNRYCFALFLPLSIFVLVYGREVIHTWVGPNFALHSAPLLPAFVLSTSFALAGQFNSSSILFGMARHQHYARSLLVEAAALVCGLLLVIPRYGILGAAWLASGLMTVNRGLVTPWIVCRYLDFRFSTYMRSIYLRPALAGVPVAVLAFWMKTNWLGGQNWVELLAALALLGASYFVLGFFFCLEREHRTMLREWIVRRISG